MTCVPTTLASFNKFGIYGSHPLTPSPSYTLVEPHLRFVTLPSECDGLVGGWLVDGATIAAIIRVVLKVLYYVSHWPCRSKLSNARPDDGRSVTQHCYTTTVVEHGRCPSCETLGTDLVFGNISMSYLC